jgi:hypothetical protein
VRSMCTRQVRPVKLDFPLFFTSLASTISVRILAVKAIWDFCARVHPPFSGNSARSPVRVRERRLDEDRNKETSEADSGAGGL